MRGTFLSQAFIGYLCLLSLLLLIALFPVSAFAGQPDISYHIPLHSSLEEDIQALYGLGYLNGIFYGFRPYSRLETARAVLKLRERLSKPDPNVSIILERLERELKEELAMLSGSSESSAGIKQVQLQTVFLDGKFSDGGLEKMQSIKNIAGRPYGNGLNLYGGLTFTSRMGDSGLLYLYPEFQYAGRNVTGEDSLYLLRLQEGYFKYHTSVSDFMVGNVPLWWGQGFNGALILSDNINPLTMVRLYKESPFTFSLPFLKTCSLTYDFFVSRLEGDRELPYPVLWGLRIGFKPFPSWEIGVARTAMFGGGDRPVNLKTIVNSFTGRGENTPEEAGNQIAGVDTNFKGYLWNQPFLIYGELYGEDQAGVWPSKLADIAGLYLPEVAGLHGNSIRVEYAEDTSLPDKQKGVWYRHHIYSDGYTYHGRIIGHSMGTDADDFLLRWDRYVSVNGKGFVSLERNRIGLFNPVHWEVRDYTAGVEFRLGSGKELTVQYTLQKVDNFNFQPDEDFENHLVRINLKKDF